MSGPRFRFPLQRLLTMRQKAESEAAIELATANNSETAARHDKDALAEQRAEARDVMLPAPGQSQTIGAIRQVAFLMEQLDSRIVGAAEVVAAAERNVQEKQWMLGERVRDRRVLDRLRDRQLESWKVEEARAERNVMDGIGSTRFMDNGRQASQTNDES